MPLTIPLLTKVLPTGQIATVEDTPIDFRNLTEIGKRLTDDFEQLKYGKEYNHNDVLKQSLDRLNFAAKILESKSNRIMKVYTNDPDIQFYGGNFLDESVVGKQEKYGYRSAFLKPNIFPTALKRNIFPSTRLNAASYKISTDQ